MADWRCQGCGATSGYLVREAQIPNYEFSNSVEALTLTAAWVSSDTGFFGKGGSRVPVKLSARVCGGCGRVEWIVQDLALLEQFARGKLGTVERL